MSAFEVFTRHLYNQFYNNPDFSESVPPPSLQEIQELALARWQCMTVSERQPYKDLASNLERERLGVEMSQTGGGSVSTTGGDDGSRKRKREPKAAKDPNMPKRPMTAFFYYAAEERPKMRKAQPELKVTEISKELGKLWREMTSEEKGKFELMAKADKKRYDSEMADYKSEQQEQ